MRMRYYARVRDEVLARFLLAPLGSSEEVLYLAILAQLDRKLGL